MKLFLSLLIGACLILCGNPAQANESWLSGGVGLSSAQLAMSLGFSHMSKSKVYSVRFVRSSEFPDMWGPDPREYLQDIGILFGLASRSDGEVAAIVSVGLGYVSGVSRGQKLPTGFINLYDRYEKISFSTAALLIQTDLYATPRFGFTIFMSINKERTWAGFLLCGRIELFK
jgi:hypothetical protein